MRGNRCGSSDAHLEYREAEAVVAAGAEAGSALLQSRAVAAACRGVTAHLGAEPAIAGERGGTGVPGAAGQRADRGGAAVDLRPRWQAGWKDGTLAIQALSGTRRVGGAVAFLDALPDVVAADGSLVLT